MCGAKRTHCVNPYHISHSPPPPMHAFPQVSPSILSANFAKLGEQVRMAAFAIFSSASHQAGGGGHGGLLTTLLPPTHPHTHTHRSQLSTRPVAIGFTSMSWTVVLFPTSPLVPSWLMPSAPYVLSSYILFYGILCYSTHPLYFQPNPCDAPSILDRSLTRYVVVYSFVSHA